MKQTPTRSAVGRIAVLALLVLAACSVASRRAGVANYWREDGRLEGIEVGSAQIGAVLDRLGPPSQMVALGEQTLLYYLLEQSDSSALFLMVYNTSDTRIAYDRAIFLFDKDGVLRQMSFSEEAMAAPAAKAETDEK